jgi:DNA polymerase III delta prime subunit
MIQKHLDKNNLHHAYLIEGKKVDILPDVYSFIESLNIKISNNPNFVYINTDSFKIEDARNLKSYASEKGVDDNKKIFIISTNNLLLEAQNSLLKLFEEPIKDTIFFLIVPDTNSLLKTLISRFYVIKAPGNQNIQNTKEDSKNVEQFIKMSKKDRLDFIKNLLKEDEDVEDVRSEDSARTKALNFLNLLEQNLHNNILKTPSDVNSLQSSFTHILKVREFLRMPGTSPKTMLESVALILPILKN